MSNQFIFYLFSLTDKIETICVFAAILSLLTMLSIAIIDEYSGDYLDNKIVKLSMKMAIVSVVLFVIVPSKKDCMMIYVGSAAIDYAQSDTSLQQIPKASANLILNLIERKSEELDNLK